MLAVLIEPVQHVLDIPGVAVKAVIELDKRVMVKAAALFLKEAVSELVIDLLVEGLEVHHLGALEEGALG